MHQDDFENEVTDEYEIPDMTEHAHERLYGWIVWAAIAVSIVGLGFVIAVSH